MDGSYRQCPECGKRALSIATRCPGCGCELPDPAVPADGGTRDSTGLPTYTIVAAGLVLVAVLASARLGRSSQPAGEQSGFVAVDTAPAIVVVPSDSAQNRGELLVARTWTRVRKSRRPKAPLEAMLMPGDTVLADSLQRGWYRVALEGEVLGYAHRSTLAPLGGR